MVDKIWRSKTGDGPIVATAIHSGHELRSNLMQYLDISEGDRLREEDPYTDGWVSIAPNQIVGTRSRFEVDLNRNREKAVYLVPEDSWGIKVWRKTLPENELKRSLEEYDLFYGELEKLFSGLRDKYGRFVVFDIHSYNHRRKGPNALFDDALENPQVNVGTGTMEDRNRWASVIDTFIDALKTFDFPSGKLDVRENVKFKGGNLAAWTHKLFSDSACVLSVEFKKFFMDEWTGIADKEMLTSINRALKSTVPGVLKEISKS